MLYPDLNSVLSAHKSLQFKILSLVVLGIYWPPVVTD